MILDTTHDTSQSQQQKANSIIDLDQVYNDYDPELFDQKPLPTKGQLE